MAFTPPHGFYNNPPAYMGYVGFVRLEQGSVEGNNDGVTKFDHGAHTLRATSADINLSQEISKPDVIDSRYDKSVYQLGPKLVDGSFAFPAIYEVPTGQTETLFETLYRYAVTRTDSGLLSPFELQVKYAASASLPNEAEFKYTGCIANTWQFSVAQSEVVTCSVDIIGVDREVLTGMDPPGRNDDDGSGGFAACTGSSTTGAGTIGTSRIITWNDARVEMRVGGIPAIAEDTIFVGGQFIRSFECNINNDAERYYALNTRLEVQAIAPRKREITGNVVLIGRHKNLADLALSNQARCTENSEIKFGYNTPSSGLGCGDAPFNVILPNIVYQIEEMSLTNDLFETTVNWHSFPAAGTGVCDPMVASIGQATFDYESDA
jgi:hypothetical protein